MNDFKFIKSDDNCLDYYLQWSCPKLLYVPFSITRVSKTSIRYLYENIRRFSDHLAASSKKEEQYFGQRSPSVGIEADSAQKNQGESIQIEVDISDVFRTSPLTNIEQSDQENIAIVIFGFNRPEKLTSLLQTLFADIKLQKFDYFAFIDGPRNEIERLKTEQSRKIAQNLLPPGSKVMAAPINQGLRQSVIAAGHQIFNSYSRAIFLEDDLLIQPGFIKFMVENLTIHQDNLEVLSISGHQPIDFYHEFANKGFNHQYHLNRPHSWGWATWRSRWIEIDWSANYLKKAALTKQTRKNLSSMGMDTVPMLISQLQGDINSWAITFCVHSSETLQKTVYPHITLTKNEGHGSESTHTGSFFRKQPNILVCLFKFAHKYFSQSFLNLFLNLIIFRYYSQRPTKVAESA